MYCHKVLCGSTLWVPNTNFHVRLKMVLTNVDTTCGNSNSKLQLFCVNPEYRIQHESIDLNVSSISHVATLLSLVHIPSCHLWICWYETKLITSTTLIPRHLEIDCVHSIYLSIITKSTLIKINQVASSVHYSMKTSFGEVLHDTI